MVMEKNSVAVNAPKIAQASSETNSIAAGKTHTRCQKLSTDIFQIIDAALSYK